MKRIAARDFIFNFLILVDEEKTLSKNESVPTGSLLFSRRKGNSPDRDVKKSEEREREKEFLFEEKQRKQEFLMCRHALLVRTSAEDLKRRRRRRKRKKTRRRCEEEQRRRRRKNGNDFREQVNLFEHSFFFLLFRWHFLLRMKARVRQGEREKERSTHPIFSFLLFRSIVNEICS